MAISPTTEGFRAAFRRPSLTFGEISWRWTTGATAAALFLFGLVEYLDTLPVTNGELLFLRTKHPYLVSEAIAHILRGSGSRVMVAATMALLLLGLLWILAASFGRIATVRAMLDYFREEFTLRRSPGPIRDRASSDALSNLPRDEMFLALADHASRDRVQTRPLQTLVRLNFLRTAVGLASAIGFAGASILASMASPDTDPRPGLAFLLFLPLAALICLAWWVLNWILSLAGLFAVRDSEDAMGAISAAVSFCRERTGPVFAVTIWTGLAHLTAFVGATTVISMPMGFIAVVPWRLVAAAMLLLTIIYFALADWLYMARLAGYVCIAETPEALPAPLPLSPRSEPPPGGERVVTGPLVQTGYVQTASVQTVPVQTTIDRDENILSDVPTSGSKSFAPT